MNQFIILILAMLGAFNLYQFGLIPLTEVLLIVNLSLSYVLVDAVQIEIRKLNKEERNNNGKSNNY